MRHGKSAWENDVKDQDRPLQERGVNDAIRVGKYIKDRLEIPDAVFSSPANRALHTCTILMRQWGVPLERLQVNGSLYDFSGNHVQQFIHGLSDELDHVMIFGHNHAFTSISNIFGNEMIDNLPTAGLVHIEFDIDQWAAITKGTTKLKIFPKQLR